MLGITLLLLISMIIYYIKVGLFSRKYTELDLIFGSIASLIIVGFFIFYGADIITDFAEEVISFDSSIPFKSVFKESFFKSIKVLKFMYILGVISCCLIPLCKLIKNRYLNLLS